ncbi:MAG: DUF4253 domain-containing protein [Actinobacteria bacterium]|nr:DUF4253 domain-containing protein [Actinomycetota bacterium]
MIAELARRLEALPPGRLPPGRPVPLEDGGAARYWLSDAPAAPGDWAGLAADFPRTGLWPLLVQGLDARSTERPWQVGEMHPVPFTPGSAAAGEVLARLWEQVLPDPDEEADAWAAVDPFRAWPGPAAVGVCREDPEAAAARAADDLLRDGTWFLCLAAVGRGADVLDAVGWSGHANHDPGPGETSAVLRSWEERFGARLVAAGFDTVLLSVAAPPRGLDEALRVAAEHHAFCPDNVGQGSGSLREYAQELVGNAEWAFWWD